MNATTITRHGPIAVTSDPAPSDASESQTFSKTDLTQLSLCSHIIAGLTESRNANGAEFLNLIQGEFHEMLQTFPASVSAVHVLRELSSYHLIETRTADDTKAKETPVWNATSVGVLWNTLYTKAFAYDTSAPTSTPTPVSYSDIMASPALIDYSEITVEASILALRRFRLITFTNDGFSLRYSPLRDLNNS